jgi:hypothetical protein
MAAVASCGQRCVVVVSVALRARHGGVRSSQRERCVVVIKGRRGPRCSVVACGASCGEARGRMGWTVSRVPIRCVAGIAICRQRCVVVIHVALRARNGYVESCERKGRVVVIEGGRSPRSRVVA